MRNERGVVLLAVLIVVTLLTILVTEFTYTVQLSQHRARNALNSLQASLLARSAINIEESFLVLDDEARFDAYTEEWWLALREFCIGVELDPTMRIACDLEDESGKININMTRTVRTAPAASGDKGEEKPTRDAYVRDALRRLFEAHNIPVDIVDQLKEYWLQEPPADSSGQTARIPEFRSLEEFAAMFQIPTRELRRLRGVLTAQPSRYLRAVNANTASAEALAALLNEPEAVTAILERQQSEEPFETAGDVRSVLDEQGIEDASALGGLFDVRSRMFRLRASAVTSMDPTGEEAGGIGQTISMLVFRLPDPRRCPPGREPPCWTLKPVDWQKEGGARLLESADWLDEEEGSQDFDDLDRTEDERMTRG